MSVCMGDSDCPRNLVCYNGTSWFYDLPESTPGYNFTTQCGCSEWYGWKGPDCTEFGTVTVALIGLVAACGFIALLHLVLSVKDMYDLFRWNGLKLNATGTTLGFIVASLTLMVFWNIFYALDLIHPEDAVRFTGTDITDDKLTKHVYASRALVPLTICFATLASLNVSLMWIEVANRAVRMKPAVSHNLTTYKRTVQLSEGFFFVLMVVASASGLWYLAVIGSYPFQTFIVVTYIVGVHKMTKVLNKASSGGQSAKTSLKTRYRSVLKRIRRTAFGVVLSVVSILVVSTGYAVTSSDWREYVGYQQVGTVIVFQSLIEVYILLTLVVLFWYVHDSAQTALRALRHGLPTTGTSHTGGSSTDGSFRRNTKLLVQQASDSSLTLNLALDDNEEPQQESQPQQVSLLQTLRSREKRQQLALYLRSKHAGEMLDFWTALDDIQKDGRVTETDLAARLLDEFVAPHSVRQINISSATRCKLLDATPDSLTVDSFAAAKKEVYDLMEHNYFANFLQTLEDYSLTLIEARNG